MLKRIVIAMLSIAVVFTAVSLILAQGGKSEKAPAKMEKPAMKEITVEGELVDLKCCTMMDKKGADHQNCAIACAKDGLPVGVLDKASGKIYLLLTQGSKIADYQAQTVKVTGTLAPGFQGIVPKAMQVLKDGKWEEVKLPEAMM